MADIDPLDRTGAVASLRLLAREGRLAETARTATPEARALLSSAAFTLVWPIVFHGLTRGYEQRRGHWTCATAVNRLTDACLDRFYDDVEAVVEDLLAHATTKIFNAEGWITMRMRPATIDAHRRRRGARGALQRPRLPGWLATDLENDPWLTQLAVEILVWVGVPGTAGLMLWPLDTWAERRAMATGDVSKSDTRTVQQEVGRVLAAMRNKPKWYADYIERPLGAKTPPLAPSLLDPPALVVTEQHEANDLRLADLASLTLAAIEAQLAIDPDDEEAIGRIITTVFGEIDVSGEVGELPYASTSDTDALTALIGDPEELHRLVGTVRDILAGGGLGGQ